MPALVTRLGDGWRRALGSLPLALVPLVLGLMDVNRIRSVLSFEGVHVGFRTGLPVSVVTVWQFVSLPRSGVDVDPGVPVAVLPVAVVTVPAFLLVQAALAAGYFGSIADRLVTGEYRFTENVAAHFRPFLLLTVLPAAVLLPPALGLLGLGAVANGGAVTPALLALLAVVVVFFYLFYPTPYLIVLRDTGLLAAARQSYALAVAGGPYLSYTGGIALFVLVVSPFATALVVDVPVLGLPAGLALGSVVGLAVNITTMRFVADIDPDSPSVDTWDDGDEEHAK